MFAPVTAVPAARIIADHRSATRPNAGITTLAAATIVAATIVAAAIAARVASATRVRVIRMPIARLAITVGRARNSVKEANAAGKRCINDVDAQTDRGAEAACERALPRRCAVWHRGKESRRTRPLRQHRDRGRNCPNGHAFIAGGYCKRHHKSGGAARLLRLHTLHVALKLRLGFVRGWRSSI